MKKIDIIMVGVLTVLIMMNAVSVTSTHGNIGGRISAKDTKTIYVGGTGLGNYSSIQQAIDDASTGYIIFVYNGTYHESIVISETVSLIGENSDTTIIDGNGARDVVYVSADRVNISGFTVKNGSKGISFFSCSNNSITNCAIHNTSDDGILFSSSSNNKITNCSVYNNSYGIYFSSSADNKITCCNVTDNMDYGIYIYNYIEHPSNSNIFHHNNFINNSQNAHDPHTNYWDDGIVGNYWDDYTGIDADADGIGDTPYSISGGANVDNYSLMHEIIFSDKEKPNIFLISPDNNSVIKPGTVIDFDITDDNLWKANYSVDSSGSQRFSPDYDITTDGWEDGTHNITVYAKDWGMNENTEIFAFTIDSVLPNMSLILPVNNSIIQPGTNLDFWINDTHLNLTTYTLNDGLPITLSSPYNISTDGLEDGTYNITIFANDLAGNEITKTFTFTIDGTKPNINITGVINGGYYNTNITPIISISDAHLNMSENVIILDDVSFESGTTVSSEGEHTLYVYAVDKAGNNMSQTIIFTIDKTKPVLEILSPTNNTLTNQNLVLTYSVSDNMDDKSNITVNILNGTVYSDEKSYIVIVNATDKAGNNAIKTITFTIDKTAPIITIAENSQTTNKNTFTMSWSVSENVQYYEVCVDGVNWVNVSTSTQHTFTLSKGANILYVRGTDFAGNKGTDMITVTYQEKKGKPGLIPGFEITTFLFVLGICIILLKRRKSP